MRQKITSRTTDALCIDSRAVRSTKYSRIETRCGPTQKGELPLRRHQALSRGKNVVRALLASAAREFWRRELGEKYFIKLQEVIPTPGSSIQLPCLNTQSFLVWKFTMARGREVQPEDRIFS